MKLKKLGLLLSTVPLLFSCGNQSVVGTYGFQLGKEAGTHFGAYLTLKDEAYQPEPGMSKFELTVSIKNGSEEEEGFMKDLLNIFDDGTGKKVLPGYYQVTDFDNKKLGGREMKIGLDFVYMVDKIKASYKEITGEDLNVTEADLAALNDSKIIQSLLDASYAADTVNIFIPVSISDAFLQLYWYGIDVRVNMADLENMVTVYDSPKHDRGTEPTAQDVAAIKEQYAADHAGCLVSEFRAYHRVKLGLQRV